MEWNHIKLTPWIFYIALAVIWVRAAVAAWKVRNKSPDEHTQNLLLSIWLILVIIIILNLTGSVNIFLCFAFGL